MLVEPELYQRIKTYVGSINTNIQDNRRQLIGYWLERDREWWGIKQQIKFQHRQLSLTKRDPALKKNGESTTVLEAQSESESLIYMAAKKGDLLLL